MAEVVLVTIRKLYGGMRLSDPRKSMDAEYPKMTAGRVDRLMHKASGYLAEEILAAGEEHVWRIRNAEQSFWQLKIGTAI